MSVVLYTTGCPQCKILESKLDSKNINYEKIDDIDLMISKGFMQAPNLGVNNKIYSFNDARKLVDGFDNSCNFEEYALGAE